MSAMRRMALMDEQVGRQKRSAGLGGVLVLLKWGAAVLRPYKERKEGVALVAETVGVTGLETEGEPGPRGQKGQSAGTSAYAISGRRGGGRRLRAGERLVGRLRHCGGR
jgi:hypothetical protein